MRLSISNNNSIFFKYNFKKVLSTAAFIVIAILVYNFFFTTYSGATVSTPVISAILPNTGPAAGGTPFTITGSNFLSNATVTFGGKQATNIMVVSSTTIIGTTPSGNSGSSSQQQNVIVTNQDTAATTSASSTASIYTYSSQINQIVKSTSADFNQSGAGFSNILSSATLNMQSAGFQWVSVNPTATLADCGVQTGLTSKGNLDCTGTGTMSLTGGGLKDGGYQYLVTAIDQNGNESLASEYSPCIALYGANNKGLIELQWKPVLSAYAYKVYRLSQIPYNNASTHNTTGNDVSCDKLGSNPDQAIGLVGYISAASGQTSPMNSLIKFDDFATNNNTSFTPPNSSTSYGGLSFGPTNEAVVSSLSGTTLTVSNNNISPAINSFISINGEYLKVTAVSGNTWTIARNSSNTYQAGRISAGDIIYAVNPSATAGNGTTVGMPSTYIGIGSMALKRSDGKYMLLNGWAQQTTTLYDPSQNGGASSFSTSNTTTTNPIGAGSAAIQRDDGNYLIIDGNGSTNSELYNANLTQDYPISAGITTTQALSAGAHTGDSGTLTISSVPSGWPASGGFYICVGGGLSWNPSAGQQQQLCNTGNSGSNGPEEMYVTGISGNTLSVIRGANGVNVVYNTNTTYAHSSGTKVVAYQFMNAGTTWLTSSCGDGTISGRLTPSTGSVGYIFCSDGSIYSYQAGGTASNSSGNPNYVTTLGKALTTGTQLIYINADNTFLVITGGNSSSPTFIKMFKFNPTNSLVTSPLTTGNTKDNSSSNTGYGSGAISLPLSGGNYVGWQGGSYGLVYGQNTYITGFLEPLTASILTSTGISDSNCTYNGKLGTGTADYCPGSFAVAGLNTSSQYNDSTLHPTSLINTGAVAMQLPNNDFLMTFGGGNVGTNIFQSMIGTYSSFINLGISSASATTGGSLVLPENNGNYLLAVGGGTTNTWNINAGFNYSGSSGTYTSEALTRPDFSSWNKISWQAGVGQQGNIQMSIANTSMNTNTCTAVPTDTTLNMSSGLSVGATSLTTSSASTWPTTGGYYIQIDNEQLLVTGGQGTTNLTVTRGVNGTSPAAHSNGSKVTAYLNIANGGSVADSTKPCLYEKAVLSTSTVPVNVNSDKGGPGVVSSTDQAYEIRSYPTANLSSITATYNSNPNSVTGIVTNNNGGTCGASGIAASDTSICVIPNSGMVFPQASNGTNKFFATIDSETVLVTNINTSTNIWTIYRGVNGSTSASHNANATIQYSPVASTNLSSPSQANLAQYATSPTAISVLTMNDTTYWDTTSAQCINGSATTLNVLNADIQGFNNDSTKSEYMSIGSQTSNYEVVKATYASSKTYTINGTNVTAYQYNIVRGQLGTTAIAHTCGQIISYGGVPVPQGGSVQSEDITLVASVYSPNATDKINTEVNIDSINNAFSGNYYSGDSINWGCVDQVKGGCLSIAKFSVPASLSSGRFHWQVRMRSVASTGSGNPTSPTVYGTTSPISDDFNVFPAGSTLRGGKVINNSGNNTQTSLCVVLAYCSSIPKLSSSITASQTTITLTNPPTATSELYSSGSYLITIDSEQMWVTGGQGTNTLNVIRGVNGTATTHSANATVIAN